MKLRFLAGVLLSFFVLSLAAQVDVKELGVEAPAQEVRPGMRVITNAVTANYLPKFADGSGTLTDSMIAEASGKLAIGPSAFTPTEFVHFSTSADANTMLLFENLSNSLSANSALRAKADTAMTTILSHATARARTSTEARPTSPSTAWALSWPR